MECRSEPAAQTGISTAWEGRRYRDDLTLRIRINILTQFSCRKFRVEYLQENSLEMKSSQEKCDDYCIAGVGGGH